MTSENRDPPPPARPLTAEEERLRRLETALAEGRAREAAAVEAYVRSTGRMPSGKVRRRWERKWDKEAKRAARDAEYQMREQDSGNPMVSFAYLAVAGACLLLALNNADRMWWLVFVALGFFLQGAKQWHHSEAKKEAAEEAERARRAALAGSQPQASQAPLPERAASTSAPVAKTEDPRVAKVEALCAKLKSELRDGPTALREVAHSPERTVEALRQGCIELVRRERELRALATPEESKRLESEREELSARVEAEGDAVVRERLSGALAALDEQRRQRAELSKAADRLGAEYTRLYYTLENLYAQVLRVRTADAAGEDVAGAGLRQSVEQLGAEVEAVTEALEEVHRPRDGRVRTR